MATGKSPPRHRHDGTSPLPLGMDVSPAPQRWNGVNTIWPHDPRTGWSYCVMIPSWITIPQAKASDGASINPTVFYKVEVGIQSPQGLSAVRGILRRFSDFLKLFAALKRIFPNKRVPAAPPKNSFMRINSSHALLQERRWALEDWLARLLADIDISRSVPIASFLELEAAARFAINSISEQQASGPLGSGPQADGPSSIFAPSPRSGYSWTGGGSSVASGPFPTGIDDGSDATYDLPRVGTPSKTSDVDLELEMESLTLEQEAAILDAEEESQIIKNVELHHPGPSTSPISASKRMCEQAEDLDEDSQRHQEGGSFTNQGNAATASQLSNIGPLASATSVTTWHRRKGSQESLVSEIESVRGSEPSVAPSVDGQMEGSLWGLGGMEEGLFETDAGLKGVSLVLPLGQRSKVHRVLIMLQRRLAVAKADMEDLIARLNQETAVKEFLATKVRDLEGDVDNTKRKSREVLQQAVSMERERVTSLQWELEECRGTLMNLEESSQSDKEERESLEERLRTAEAYKELAEKEVTELHENMAQLRKERDMIKAQSQADKKVLVKEIKSLRSAQPEIKREMEEAQQAKVELEKLLVHERTRQERSSKSRLNFLREVMTLRQRLQECTVDYLAREEEKLANKSSSGVTDALDLLSTSDNRIGLLLAEAQLLAQQCVGDSSSSGQLANGMHINGEVSVPEEKLKESAENADSDTALRRMLTDLIIDNAQLRKAMNHSLTQSALSSHRGEKEVFDGSAFRKSVLSKFLGTQ